MSGVWASASASASASCSFSKPRLPLHPFSSSTCTPSCLKLKGSTFATTTPLRCNNNSIWPRGPTSGTQLSLLFHTFRLPLSYSHCFPICIISLSQARSSNDMMFLGCFLHGFSHYSLSPNNAFHSAASYTPLPGAFSGYHSIFTIWEPSNPFHASLAGP